MKRIDECLGQLLLRIFRFLWIALCLIFIFPTTMAQGEEAPVISARAAVLVERRSGRVLYAQDEQQMMPMASVTKIMTALLALENSDLTEIVTASERASGTTGTSIYLGVGEQLTMEQMLQALMLRSGNDAAVAIAEHIDGSVEAFADRMNERARQIGAEAHFVNPHGLDESGHEISALGMAQIACAALNHPTFRQLVATQRAVIPWRDSEYDRVLSNKNKLLTTYEGATGVKTGFTSKAGRCLVFSAERDGMELVGVVFNCGTWFDSAKALLDWGFDTFTAETIAVAGAVLTEVPIRSGARQSVGVVAEQSIIVPLRQGEDPVLFVDVPEQLTAPVEAGSSIGVAWVEVDGKPMARVELMAHETVGEWGYIPAFRRVARCWAIGANA